eukprot:TRINITY_DN16006_c0_g1_i1.p1 TRINITY_DN16006_c0_g1~~TRINITY_DN16006_c0_g1_i1.p1  ORF type:complete len:283 (-),score=58.31 TRINITY_DN16006_c0_g1_i1:337-1185(-)
MAFRFNFAHEEAGEQAVPTPLDPEPEPMPPAQEVAIEAGASGVHFTPTVLAETIILYRGSVKPVEGALAEATADSDLIPHGDERVGAGAAEMLSLVYEGGFKLWECAVDLSEYMLEELQCDREGAMTGKRVIELGCGHGLPGILALKAGAQVDFCDFNEEVLVGLTIPNVLENSKAVAISARFFSGDWGSLPEVLGGCKYDLILTSDTLYSPESLKSLGAVLGQLLAPGGVALVAAKSYYFGVGGGTDMFVDWVHTNTKLKVEVAKTYQDGATNVREMLRVS